MTEIMGELLLAALRLTSFLRREHPRVTRALHVQAMRLPKLIRAEVKAFLNDEPPEKLPKMPGFDYLKTLEQLSRPVEPHDLENMVDAHQEPENAIDFWLACQRAIAYLSGVAPRRVKQTLTGFVQLVPSDQEVERLKRAYAVIEDPAWPLRKMRNLSLLPDEVAALVTVYPGVYKLIGDTVREELANAKTRKGAKWNLSPEKEQQLMLLLQMRQDQGALVRDLQAGFEGEPPPDQMKAPRPSKIDLKADSMKTGAQAAEAAGRG